MYIHKFLYIYTCEVGQDVLAIGNPFGLDYTYNSIHIYIYIYIEREREREREIDR